MNDVHSGVSAEDDYTFAELLSNFEQSHTDGARGEAVTGTIVSTGPDTILVDVGRKIEGSLPFASWRETHQADPEMGATISVTIGPRGEDGYYQLSTVQVERPKDWAGLQAAFAEKKGIAGTVVEQVKGGFRVDVGVRAFLPASRSGTRDTEEAVALVGQEIRCRITKLDVEKEDVVVDRRIVLEEEQAKKREESFAQLREGSIVRGTVRSVMDFGAFIDLGGIDGLLHVADMAYSRVEKASDLVKPGDELNVKILKIDPGNKKISLGLKQLQEDPWSIAMRTFQVGQRVSGTVSRLTDFGAFVELLPGVDGLIHVSELSWNKRVRKPGDLLKIGERVETVILQFNTAERKIGLGYKQVLGDPWEKVSERMPVGTTVEGPVTNLTDFGAFIDLSDGIEGMIHISDITSEKRLNHPREKLAKGQTVRAIVLELDKARKKIKLGMKQLEPTAVDHYIAAHKTGETVSGRVVEVRGDQAKVELGEEVLAQCRLDAGVSKKAESPTASVNDISSLGALLAAKWKEGKTVGQTENVAQAGQVRSFRISSLDPAKRLIQLELAS